MSKLINAATAAGIIAAKYNISLAELVDTFAEIPAAGTTFAEISSAEKMPAPWIGGVSDEMPGEHQKRR